MGLSENRANEHLRVYHHISHWTKMTKQSCRIMSTEDRNPTSVVGNSLCTQEQSKVWSYSGGKLLLYGRSHAIFSWLQVHYWVVVVSYAHHLMVA
jgi:hypothetical protein